MTARHEYRRIDAHTHAGMHREAFAFRGSPIAYVKRMRREGIDAIVLLGRGEIVSKAAKKFGDFVVPVPMYHLREIAQWDLRKDMEHWLDRGCKGVKFIDPLYPYSDERYWPLYEVAVQRRVPAIFHTGYLFFPREGPQNPPVEIVHMRPAHVDAVARRFPSLKILMSHYGNPWWEEAWKVTWNAPNVYADLSGGTAYRRDLTMWQQIFAPNGQLIEECLAKLLFASDMHYLHHRDHGVQAYIDFYQKLLDRLNAPQRLRKLVWAGTARKLFGLK